MLRCVRRAGKFRARMKAATALAILFCAASAFGASGNQARTEKFSILGKEYVRLDEWARANSFHWKWLSKSEALLWNNSSRMQFMAESKRMSLDAVTVLLSEAVRIQNG